ncbi:hypothetical protein [Stenotrophomonas maltophilia]|uniref:Uncharacterized protein n=1 Tax=Stenotrophomonas maltophilia TaxID=40324 RepID=A0A246I5R1_STEMA|nr:hypothetical protein [Stenotrophomonas maltophilia]OWQ73824.1 hypothetical protein CEE63_11765 [Stenotrophomonas maltophilia]
MAIVDIAFREWIADFKAANPSAADSRAILDTAQYAFAAGRKAQREIDAARQPVGQIVGYMDPNADFMLARPGDCVLMGNIVLWREPGSKYTKPLYDAPPAKAVDLANVIDQIAQQWDGCSYDAVGETIDVGQAIRAAGKRLANTDSQAVGK